MKRKKATGKYQEDSAKFGFYNWNLDAFEELLKKGLDTLIKEAIELATKEYEVCAFFDSDSDPDRIIVEIPLGATDEDSPIWDVSLKAMVDASIEWSKKEDLTLLRDHFLKMLEKMNKAIEEEDE